MGIYWIWIYLLATPWVASVLMWPEHDSARWLQTLLFWLLAFHVWWYIRSFRGFCHWPNESSRVGLRWFVVPVLSLLPLVMAPELVWAWAEWMVFAGLVVLACVIGGASYQQRMATVLIAATATGVYAFGVVAMVLLGLSQGMASQLDSSIQGFSNIRFWNHVQTVAIPLTAAALYSARAGLQRVFFGASLLLCFSLLWATAGRATSVSLFASAALLLLLYRLHAWNMLRGVGLLAVGGAFLGESLVRWIPEALNIPSSALQLFRPTHLQSEAARIELWTRAWELFVESPWLGVGPMHFSHFPNPIAAHPHNVYLQSLAEWGLLATAAWVVLVSVWITRLVRLTKTDWCGKPPMGIWMLWGCLAVLMDGLFSGNFVMPVSQIWIAVLCGLAWGHYRDAIDRMPSLDNDCERANMVSLVMASAWLGASTLFAIWTTAGFFSLSERVAMPANWDGLNQWIAPRFWWIGWF